MKSSSTKFMNLDHPILRVRRNAWNRYELGTIFIEKDGPYEIVNIAESVDKSLGRFDYTLRKFTPEEVVIWQVMAS